MPDLSDFESAAVDAGEHRYGYVMGKDGLWHLANDRGFIACGMGRIPSPVYVIVGPVTCLECVCKPWRRW